MAQEPVGCLMPIGLALYRARQCGCDHPAGHLANPSIADVKTVIVSETCTRITLTTTILDTLCGCVRIAIGAGMQLSAEWGEGTYQRFLQTKHTGKGGLRQPEEDGEMNEAEKKAYLNGVADKMHGYKSAYPICKKRAASGCKMSAAYCKGYANSGVGE